MDIALILNVTFSETDLYYIYLMLMCLNWSMKINEEYLSSIHKVYMQIWYCQSSLMGVAYTFSLMFREWLDL